MVASNGEVDNELLEHKQDLANLKETDPEFYKFLKKEDKALLDFDIDDDGDEENVDQKFHRPPSNLEEVLEDDEDNDNEIQGEEEQSQVTVEMIEKWSAQLEKSQPPLTIIRHVIRSFGAAVLSAYGTDVDDKKKKKKSKTKSNVAVDNPDSFNTIVRCCLKQLIPAIYRFLKIKPEKKKLKPETSTNWKYLSEIMKKYLMSFARLISMINVPSTLNSLLRHIRTLIPFILAIPITRKPIVKELIIVWSTATDEKSRVISFVCLFHITRENRKEITPIVLRKMYFEYLKNCKFTSPTSLPLINFMQRSLVEMYSIAPSITYQHAFVFIRQLAIHLRSATIQKKPENIQNVYNWQYIHALSLWTNVIGLLYKEALIKQLIHPLCEVIIGTIRLVPIARYYPLRFHCIRSLIKLTTLTDTFIPVVPFLIEVFDITDFNKKHKTASLKAQYINFDTALKLSKLQMEDRAYKDGLMDQLYELFILYLVNYSYHFSFPELIFPVVLKFKSFLKTCQIQNFCKVIKGLLEKLQENAKVIEDRRQKTGLNIKDIKQMETWLENSKQEQTPLKIHYQRYLSLRQREVLEDIAQKEKISARGRAELPELIRPTKFVNDKQDFKNLIEKDISDNDDNDEDGEFFQLKKKRKHDSDESEEEEEDEEDELDEIEETEVKKPKRSKSDSTSQFVKEIKKRGARDQLKDLTIDDF
ncbi:unnamed protein product [Didymodactylos carnosus]|uniref:Nucleolar complex protein 2 homolog n=1 Tax=Didymodactylos carnosus TaxID=1234261 RepID=A0A8S2E8H8_9BILA|nr:unnamed protein product [Didymodactylos carnosus]CAF3854793.1 unnamed protein product [Didymodactylos carnosus]